MASNLLPQQWKKWASALLLLLVIFPLNACKAQSMTAATSSEKPVKKPPIGTRLELSLEGYNYTNKYIDEFSVDGQGGGNLFVSGATSGGGGSICCVTYFSGQSSWTVAVRWQTSACTFDEYIDGGEKFFSIHSFFKEAMVPVDLKATDNPTIFEVHFFPDGHVEAAITAQSSEPRLKLDPKREDRSHYPQCPNDKEPAK